MKMTFSAQDMARMEHEIGALEHAIENLDPEDEREGVLLQSSIDRLGVLEQELRRTITSVKMKKFGIKVISYSAK